MCVEVYMGAILLKPGREKSILRRHPWIFSGAIAEVRGSPGDGETIDVIDSRGAFLARAAFSAHSQIRARIWTWDPDEKIGLDFFRSKLIRSVETRTELIDQAETDAWRLVHGESDGLPGLIVDRYGSTLVVQFLSAGVERWREDLADLLKDLADVDLVYERSDAEVRELEGLPSRAGPIRGSFKSEEIQIQENGLRWWVNLRRGHKTGFYLDQRLNRLQVRRFAAGRRVLDCFSFTGGFTLPALDGGAQSVLSIDSSAEALEQARLNLELNGLSSKNVEWVPADVFQALRGFRDRRRTFDLIILDPPKFAASAAQVERAARGYKDINLLAFKLLNPGGLLITFSCSGSVSDDLFQKIVAGAALDAGVTAQIVERLHQGADHPVALNFPEGAYLKGFVIRKGG